LTPNIEPEFAAMQNQESEINEISAPDG